MKICFINNVYNPDEVRGGAERSIRDLTDYLTKRGHSITIIERTLAYKRLAALPKWRRLLHHVFSIVNISSYIRLKEEIKAGNFDLVWAHNLTGFGLLALRALGTKGVVHTFHDIQYLHPSGLLMYGQEKKLESFTAQVYRMIVRQLFSPQALIIFPSQWLASLYISFGFAEGNNYLVVHNPVEATEPLEKKLNEIFTFLYLGQIEEHKGVPLLVRTFSQFQDLPARLIIAGSGTIAEKLARKNSDKRIFFTGSYENPYQQLAQADCLVIPSTCYENLPTVGIEAALAKVPVIGSNTGGTRELINEESLLFEPNSEQLGEKLKWACLHQSELIQISEEGRARLRVLGNEEYLTKIGTALGVTF